MPQMRSETRVSRLVDAELATAEGKKYRFSEQLGYKSENEPNRAIGKQWEKSGNSENSRPHELFPWRKERGLANELISKLQNLEEYTYWLQTSSRDIPKLLISTKRWGRRTYAWTPSTSRTVHCTVDETHDPVGHRQQWNLQLRNLNKVGLSICPRRKCICASAVRGTEREKRNFENTHKWRAAVECLLHGS